MSLRSLLLVGLGGASLVAAATGTVVIGRGGMPQSPEAQLPIVAIGGAGQPGAAGLGRTVPGELSPAPTSTADPSVLPTPDPTPTPSTTGSPAESPTDAPTATPTQATTDACGTRPAKPDGTLWSCTFDDEFNGSELDRSKWLPQTNFVSGTAAAHACYLDDPDNVSVANGTLALTVRHEDEPVPCVNKRFGDTTAYSAGSVATYHLFSQQYGRFEARFKVQASRVPGLQETFWLWPDDRTGSTETWPAAGEMDVAELYSQYPHLVVPFLHYTANDNGGPVPGVNTAWDCAAERGVFNTYTLVWTPSRIEVDVNGQACLVNTSGDPAFQKPYIIVMSALLGTGANALTANTPLPATTTVDYVRAWD